MIGKTHTEQVVLDCLEFYLSMDCRKPDIYTKVCEETNVPRPTVKRIARDLRQHYQKRISQLQDEITTTEQSKGDAKNG